jgi:hypothetical protein
MIQKAQDREPLTLDNYHRCDWAISRGQIKDLRKGARTFEAKHINRTWEDDDETKEAFIVGRAVNDIVLLNRDKRLQRPDKWKDWKTKASQEWKKERIAEGYMPAGDKVNDKIEGAIRSIRAALANLKNPHLHPNVRIEKPIVWEHTCTDGSPLTLRCMPDILVVVGDQAWAYDLKTILHLTDKDVRNQISDFGYDLQLAHYSAGIRSLGLELRTFTFVFGEKSQPYRPGWSKTIDSDDVAGVESDWKSLLDELSVRLRENDWSEPQEHGVGEVSMRKKWAD